MYIWFKCKVYYAYVIINSMKGRIQQGEFIPNFTSSYFENYKNDISSYLLGGSCIWPLR